MRPSDRSYAESHEWAKLNGDIVLVGITDFAVEQLGELVYLDLPKPGRVLRKGESFGEVESVKAVSDLYAPADGEIVEVNSALSDDLDTLQTDPFGGGWLIKLRIKAPAQALSGLLDAKSYEQRVAAAH
ncbi:MAG: glycine cleavage system protein GcvH [Planctomycetota bacterium]|nr:MAG: glycine cleavage system protein GcvH [Planctomycetota bacterium]